MAGTFCFRFSLFLVFPDADPSCVVRGVEEGARGRNAARSGARARADARRGVAGDVAERQDPAGPRGERWKLPGRGAASGGERARPRGDSLGVALRPAPRVGGADRLWWAFARRPPQRRGLGWAHELRTKRMHAGVGLRRGACFDSGAGAQKGAKATRARPEGLQEGAGAVQASATKRSRQT